MGFTDVYDFIPGKTAWLAMGWGREGGDSAKPNVGDLARTDLPVCKLGAKMGEARTATEGSPHNFCLVTNEESIFMGRLSAEAMTGDAGELVDQAMEGGSSTVRPSEALEALTARMTKKGVGTMVVTDLKGRLLGVLFREDAEAALVASPK